MKEVKGITEENERAKPGEGEIFANHLARYQFAKNFVAGKVVYSLACGVGYGEYLLAREGGAKKVVGIDNSEEAIAYAKKNYQTPNLIFKKEDALSTSLEDNLAEAIISFETIEHVVDDEKFLRELRRLLKPNGLLIISTPNKASSFKNLLARRSFNVFHLREYKKGELEKILTKYFKILNMYGQKEILKRSLPAIPKYLFYKLTGKLGKIEINDFTVKPYPEKRDRGACFFVVVCQKK